MGVSMPLSRKGPIRVASNAREEVICPFQIKDLNISPKLNAPDAQQSGRDYKVCTVSRMKVDMQGLIAWIHQPFEFQQRILTRPYLSRALDSRVVVAVVYFVVPVRISLSRTDGETRQIFADIPRTMARHETSTYEMKARKHSGGDQKGVGRMRNLIARGGCSFARLK
ncbi:hypothetical protein ACRALDRAFT_206731 [Sodiomyces alcalophilus JCM 7366]|uniref:uncharacterized protein n=1 Tax=Sodiomyces alcalophilus JCM 7366 TaxID=591952 RepID=UPI0039B6138D